MEPKQSNVEQYEKFTWKVENFTRLKNKVYYSEPFVLGGYTWRINLYPKGNKVDTHLSMYLKVMDTVNMSEGWNRDVKFKLLLFNQLDPNKTISNATSHKFNATKDSRGYASFVTLTRLHDSATGYIVKDACIVGAEVFVSELTNEKPVNFESQTGHVDVQIPEPKITNQETLSTVSNLACIKTSKPGDAELGYAAMGKVLYFLNTRKVKDMMNEQACKELQILWGELKKFKFDLTWLEPQVHSALGFRSYVEKALEVEKLRCNVANLQLETERLKTKLDAAQVNLDIERDLLKAKGIEERDLTSELGTGSWKP